MIKVDGIYKSFGEVRAVRGVSFDAPDGKITGLLGPNGAGKSTTLRVLYTVLKPDAGSAVIDGIDVVDDGLRVRPTTRESALRALRLRQQLIDLLDQLAAFAGHFS